jgi:protein-S-isoprenylcysteine O-methyltransferase Ste14
MLIAIFFAVKPYFNGIEYMANHLDSTIKDFNTMLIFMGLGISFSTLQDTQKTQNEFSKRVWQSPKKSRRMLIMLSISIVFIFSFGIFAYFFTANEKIKELSFGVIVFGIGLMGLLKAAIEMAENHRIEES